MIFMKTKIFYRAGATFIVAAFLTMNVLAQDSTSSAPKLSYGVPAVLQLTQAKVGDDTIVAYIQNSPTIYSLDASQIIYLKQQGVSSAVLNAMLNQRARLVDANPTSAPTSTSANSTTEMTASTPAQTPQVVGDASTAVAQPTVTYTTAPSVYVIPDTQSDVYDSGFYSPYYYGWGYPAVSLSFGWGGGGHWGGGWRGYHGGGGFHGSAFHGGGFHGGSHR
jgi:hypothetical protein